MNTNWITPDWPLPSAIHAAVTLRSDGVSSGGYASFNLAAHVGDEADAVARNRALLRERLALPGEPVWLQQVHGNRVIRADRAVGLEAADASVTNETGVVCVVLTADCLPVLFCGDDGQVIAAAHVGWRGLKDGIIASTLAAMGSKRCSVWLGPAIGPDCFEVGDDVRAAFVDDDPRQAAAFSPHGNGKWLADIYALARRQLTDLGVESIYGGGYCTVTDVQRFYSFRRDGAVSGRMASLIWRC
ncbi:MAG: peptidoglycan editing factor PgeF [Methylomonas sp.]|nr:peptidoglycan editing factor PgeF [Methylomonas sp.]PPD20971.1 MAG: multi-copper polyphenol oxidoreductase [Methylomonas sp.]PPD27216.1 MAG: multi-copper polyphenol oxidoreductase [Methylomonas sp.]PPD39166.1 MAG: multi-copper polyphenol oxidoreductase [Methylomonas sp.]PPD41325.1 MAG: multi-copper polyphenol oxidoreductase [Methylomonas sp.]